MSRLDKYLERERWYVFAMLFVFLAVETSINATSLLMNAAREGDSTPAWTWFVLEYSSGLAMLAVFPAVLWYERRFPLAWASFRKNIGWHIPGSLAFTLLHMLLMGVFRKLAFALAGSDYSFNDLSWQFLYEYRQDAWTYAGFLCAIYIYRFIMSRLRGEAHLVPEGENSPPETVPDRLLIKKLGKEFIVRVDEIEWLESAGNYVNLHAGKRIYPLRSTLSSLVEKLEPRGFRRTHRSVGVNLEFVTSIVPLDSGDAEVVMAGGHKLPLSRRYRDEFRRSLGLEQATP